MSAPPGTVLVTGATGFVGAAVARALRARGAAVRALVRPESDRANLAGLDVELATGDLRDAPSLERAARGCSTLFHVAADYRIWAPRPAELYATNVAGTAALMDAALAAGVERVVYTSSVAVLGSRADGGPADEETPVSEADMIGPYKHSKFLAEREVRERCERAGLPAVVVNPTTPVGPGDVKPTPTGRMVRDAAAGRMPAYVDTGLNIVHVDDVAEGHLLAWERGRIGERYVLGGEDLPLREILARIAVLAGRRPPRWRLAPGLLVPLAFLSECWARVAGTSPQLTRDALRMARKRMYFSHAKAARELGYRPRDAQHALRDAVSWFRDGAGLS